MFGLGYPRRMILIEHLKVIWCRLTHTGIETETRTTSPAGSLVVTTTVYTRCLECGRAR